MYKEGRERVTDVKKASFAPWVGFVHVLRSHCMCVDKCLCPFHWLWARTGPRKGLSGFDVVGGEGKGVLGWGSRGGGHLGGSTGSSSGASWPAYDSGQAITRVFIILPLSLKRRSAFTSLEGPAQAASASLGRPQQPSAVIIPEACHTARHPPQCPGTWEAPSSFPACPGFTEEPHHPSLVSCQLLPAPASCLPPNPWAPRQNRHPAAKGSCFPLSLPPSQVWGSGGCRVRLLIS